MPFRRVCCWYVQVIEQTNDLKRLELELQQEEVRIMTEMTRIVAISQVRRALFLHIACLGQNAEGFLTV